MTRLELLQLVVARARAHGFEFRRWYVSRLQLPWISAEASICLLEQQRRYYALVFSHEFAQTFWKPGADLSFEVPAQSFTRVMPDGSIRQVQRKAFIRRSARPEAWRYHLRQMALAEEPLRYLRKYLPIEDHLEDEAAGEAKWNGDQPWPPGTSSRKTKQAAKTAGFQLNPACRADPTTTRPAPAGLPAFLNRPYPPPLGPEKIHPEEALDEPLIQEEPKTT